MIKKVFLRSELVERTNLKKVSIHGYNLTVTELLSPDWANSLIRDLDAAKDRVRKIHNAFSNAIRNKKQLETVKHELACTPVAFTLRESYKTGANAISQVPFTQAVNSDYTFEVGTNVCPNSIFPHNINLWHGNHKRWTPAWAFYPPDIAQKANIKTIKTWTPDDSLVDWITKFIRLKDPEASIRVDQLWETDDISYTFYFPTTFPRKKYNVSIQEQSRSEQVYDFIYKYGPVRTRRIEKHIGIQRQQINTITRKLEQDNRIEKVRHGVYVPVCETGN